MGQQLWSSALDKSFDETLNYYLELLSFPLEYKFS